MEKPEFKFIFHETFTVSSGFYARGAAATLTAVNVLKKILTGHALVHRLLGD